MPGQCSTLRCKYISQRLAKIRNFVCWNHFDLLDPNIMKRWQGVSGNDNFILNSEEFLSVIRTHEIPAWFQTLKIRYGKYLAIFAETWDVQELILNCLSMVHFQWNIFFLGGYTSATHLRYGTCTTGDWDSQAIQQRINKIHFFLDNKDLIEKWHTL